MHQEIIPWKREQNKNRLLDNVNENLYLCGGLQTDANNMSKIKETWLWVKQHKYAVTIIGFVLLVCVIDPHFTDGLYTKIAQHAIDEAMRIKAALQAKGIGFLIDSPTNQQFPILTDEKSGEELFIAMALLPPNVDVGTRLLYEMLEYTVI